MKMTKMLSVLLILSLVFCGCAAEPAQTQPPETTQAPTEPAEVKEVFTWEDMKGIDHT